MKMALIWLVFLFFKVQKTFGHSFKQDRPKFVRLIPSQLGVMGGYRYTAFVNGSNFSTNGISGTVYFEQITAASSLVVEHQLSYVNRNTTAGTSGYSWEYGSGVAAYATPFWEVGFNMYVTMYGGSMVQNFSSAYTINSLVYDLGFSVINKFHLFPNSGVGVVLMTKYQYGFLAAYYLGQQRSHSLEASIGIRLGSTN